MNKKNNIVFLFALILCFSINYSSVPSFAKFTTSTLKASQEQFRIKQKNPVVNEGNQIILTTQDSNGSPINGGVIWQSGSPDIAQVNPTTGEVFGIKSGFATITARRGEETSSVFIVVVKVKKGNGAKVPGDAKTDSSGGTYISNPIENVILKADNINSPVKIYAGTPKVAGNKSGDLKEALFAGPTALGIDNSSKGGIYVADTLNHSIRKITFDNQVETVIGLGSPGLSAFNSSEVNFEQARFSSPRGIVTNAGGNLFIADTDNHAIYYADLTLHKLFLLAGEPGQNGKSDGLGRNAKFNRPSGMALSNDGKTLVVADQDNNLVRLIEISFDNNGAIIGKVSSLGTSTSTQKLPNTSNNSTQDIIFDKPQSVGLDATGNIYVVDNSGVQVITRSNQEVFNIIPLAQPNITFNKPVSLTVKGSEVFVLDDGMIDSQALNVVSVGGPEIVALEPATVNLGQTQEITIRGKSFAPESQVIFDGNLITNTNVVSATEIRFIAPSQNTPGKSTISVLTRGGLAQETLSIVSKPVSMLATGEITTIAGGKKYTGDGGQALQNSIYLTNKTIVDSNNNLYMATSLGVRRVDAETKIVTTIAGQGNSIENGILATTAKLSPNSIALDNAGDLYVADGQTNTIRRINMLTNIISTFAGNGSPFFSGDGGPAINAGFESLVDITFDTKGNLLVLEATRLRRISPDGIISTIAGNGKVGFGGDGALATAASFSFPNSLDVDKDGNIFVADYGNDRIRQISPNGIISTIAGNGKKAKVSQKRDGKSAKNVVLNLPSNIAVSDGKLFIADFNSPAQIANSNVVLATISQVDLKTGLINTKPIKLPADQSIRELYTITSLRTDGTGNLFFSTLNFIYRLNLNTGEATPVAGNSKSNFIGDDALAQRASTGDAFNAVTDSNGNLYVADFFNNLVRKIDSSGIATTIVGKDTSKTTGIGDGAAALNAIVTPYALTVTNNGNLLIADVGSAFLNTGSRVRQVNLTTGVITTIAGNGSTKNSGDGGSATQAGISFIYNIATDSQNNIYLNTEGVGLRKIDAKTGIITTLAKTNSSPGSSLVIDKSDRLLFCDGSSSTINQIDLKTGKTSILVKGKADFSGDGGPLSQAGLGAVTSLAIDQTGNLFILGQILQGADLFSSIRKVDAKTGIITTIAHGKNNDYTGDGTSASQANVGGLNTKLTTDTQGNLYIVISNEVFNSVRFIKLFSK
jgi:sugar lactone lactonase YvrE